MPQSIYEGFSYIGETIGSYTGDFDADAYEGAVTVDDPTTLQPVQGAANLFINPLADPAGPDPFSVVNFGSYYTGPETPPVGDAFSVSWRDNYADQAYFPVRAGESYIVSTTAKRVAGTAALQLLLWLRDSDGNTGAGIGDGSWNSWALTPQTFSINNDDDWTRYSAHMVLDDLPGLAEATGYFRIDQAGNAGTEWLIADVSIQRVNSQPEVVLSTVTDSVWILDDAATAVPYYVDTGLPPTDATLDWPKVPVINWVEGGWIQLNADIGIVDYSISNISWNRALLTIQDHKNFEYLDYEMVIDGPGVSNAPRSLPDDTASVWLDNLTHDSTYQVTLLVNLVESDGLNIQGKDTYANIQAIVGAATEDVWIQSDQTPEGDIGDGWMWDGDSWENIGALQSKPSVQSFTTPDNPPPKAVIDLSSPARTNTWIDLKWSNPPGTSATTYKVYQGYYGGPTKYVKTVSGTTTRIANLREDRKYRYYVRGVNANGLEGPWSNELRWATGHGEIRRTGTDNNILWWPAEWGSYRQDIRWRWARPNGIAPRNPHIYQGYWPGNNWRGASNPAQNIAAGNTRRYWGTITYSGSALRNALDRKHGGGVGSRINITSLKIMRVYRHRTPGIYSNVGMNWHLTNANPFDSGQPPLHGSHWGSSMRAGTYIGMYGLPASWGKHLLSNRINGGTWVNGLVLHRADNQTNGYGAAGYGAWSGHNLRDPHYSGSWRYSDLRLALKGNWNFPIRAYKGPWRW